MVSTSGIAFTIVDTIDVIVEWFGNSEVESNGRLSDVCLECLGIISRSDKMSIVFGVNESFLNLVLVACLFSIDVGVKISTDSTVLEEPEDINGPATLAAKIFAIPGAVDDMLLRKTVEGTVLDSVGRLKSTDGSEE